MAFVPRTWVVGEVVTAALMNQEIRDGIKETYEEVMAPTSLASLGAFSANFSAGSRTPRLHKYRLGGILHWQYDGNLNITSGTLTANTTVTAYTHSGTSHRVGSERQFPAGAAQSSHFPARLGFTATGTIQVSVPTGAGNNTSVIWLDVAHIPDPLRV